MSALLHRAPSVFFASVEGIDVSSTFNRYLIKAVIVDGGGGGSDTAELVFDDSYGQLEMPRTGAELIVGLGWQDTGPTEVFTGHTDAPRSFGSREGGRLLSLRATGDSPVGLLKQTQEVHLDGGSFADAAKHFAEMVGLNVQVDSALGQVQRDYWAMGKQSFTQWGEKMARQLGGTLKIAGNTARFISQTAGSTPSGSQYPVIVCEAGANLIRWELTPVYNKPKFGSFRTNWYDLDRAEHHYEELTAGIPNVPAALINRFKMFSEAQAKQVNSSNMAANNALDEAENHVTINGEPLAMSQGTATVIGARDGIDGDYRIEQATHILVRGQGYITELTLREPAAGGAAKPATATPFPSSSEATPGATTPSSSTP